ncbi:branched-chain amino acid transport system permease protein [Rhodoligotrophos appendicifer]|uniref:branched-chain amino acid ABC transporter permease n=1 Tax=Rhodoligotrophos appendicifer TaxID=987056 RepID=UPI001186D4B4|nr:branched-chain amino acid ABC transporter permease [Rhodoligotrophos appendicifer]
MANKILPFIALAVLAILPLLTGSTYLHHLLVLWMLYALLALSLNIIVGYLGELTFGHAAFFGIGAYAAAILGMDYGLPGLPALLFAGFIAGVFGLVIGYVALRIVGPQFAILTLGFGSIIYTVTNYWVDVTRGPMGISNIPPLSFGPEWLTFSTAQEYYYVALACVVIFAYACYALVHSRTGRAFIATRENPNLASSLGIDIFHMKLLGFVVATVVAGIGGALYAHYVKVITPELMGLQYMSALIIMVIVGGRGTIAGPIIGALIYVGLLELLRPLGAMRLVIFAALLIASVIFLPGGIVSLWRRYVEQPVLRKSATPQPDARREIAP